MDWTPRHPAFQALIAALQDATTPVYVVGGAVRDHLLGLNDKVTDLDLVILEEALPRARRAVANRLGWAFYPLDEGRDVARLVFTANADGPLVCDISSTQDADIASDLAQRDFTINAMAFVMPRRGRVELLDPCGGAADLQARRIRRVNAVSLAADPLRMLRAVRFAAHFDFTLEEQTELQIRRICHTIKLCSPERVRDELWKMLTMARPAVALQQAQALSLVPFVLPELSATESVQQSSPHYLDVFRHTLLTVSYAAQLRDWLIGKLSSPPAERGWPASAPWDAGSAQTDWQVALHKWQPQLRHHFSAPLAGGRTRGEWLVWHALFHDLGKPVTRTIERPDTETVRYRFFDHASVGARMTAKRLTHLRFSRQEIALCSAVVQAHMRPHLLDASFGKEPISHRAMYRFFRDVGGTQFEQPVGVDTLLLALADFQAIYEAAPEIRWRTYLGHIDELLTYAFEENGLRSLRSAPLVDGHRLMLHLEIAPGCRIGELLKRLSEAQAAGDITSEEDALDLASSLVREMDS